MYSIEMPSDSRYKGRSASNKSVPPLRKASTKMIKEAKVDSLNARSDSVTEAGFFNLVVSRGTKLRRAKLNPKNKSYRSYKERQAQLQ